MARRYRKARTRCCGPVAPLPGCGQNIDMARLRRRWRVVKWAGVALSALILFAWSVSILADLVCLINCGDGSIRLAVVNGCLDFGSWYRDWHREVTMHLRRRTGSMVWQPDAAQYFGSWTVTMPLWIPFLLLVVPTGILFWLDRGRMPAHCCQGCGYDLTGNTSGACPECGESS